MKNINDKMMQKCANCNHTKADHFRLRIQEEDAPFFNDQKSKDKIKCSKEGCNCKKFIQIK